MKKSAIYAALALFMLLTVGFVGGNSVKACEEAGNSTETCLATMNP